MFKLTLAALLLSITAAQTFSITQSKNDDKPNATETTKHVDADNTKLVWQCFELEKLLDKRQEQEKAYLEFLRVSSLNCGIYVLGEGAKDGQSPHKQDELYYIIKGKAILRVGNEDQAVKTGSIVYVAREIEHQFHSIEEELTVLVFFATGPIEDFYDKAKSGD